jgi:hypothetical protein
MTHVLIPAPDIIPAFTCTVTLPDGTTYSVTFRDGEAYLPDNVGRFLIENGQVTQGPGPAPKPRWEWVDGCWGALIDPFDQYCQEIK